LQNSHKSKRKTVKGSDNVNFQYKNRVKRQSVLIVVDPKKGMEVIKGKANNAIATDLRRASFYSMQSTLRKGSHVGARSFRREPSKRKVSGECVCLSK